MNGRIDVDRDLIRINQLFNKRAAIGPIPASQFPVWIMLGGGTFFILRMMLALSYPVWLCCWVWMAASYWMLTGDRDYRFFKRWGIPPGEDWINNNSLFIPVNDRRWKERTQHRAKAVRANIRDGVKRFMGFQEFSHIHSIAEIKMGKHQFACILLYDPHSKQWSAQIPFQFQGFHSQLYIHEVEAFHDNINRCMSEVFQGEFMTFQMSCRSNFRDRTQELEDLALNSRIVPVSVLLWNEQNRMQDITERGIRQTWEQTIWVSWTAQKHGAEQTDPIGKAVSWFENTIQGFSRSIVGTEQLYFQDFYLKTARQIFEYGYLPWRNLLETKANLTVEAMTAEQMLSGLWYRFNQHPYHEIPEVIRIADVDGSIQQTIPMVGTKDIVSWLIQGQEGQTACPKHRGEKGYIYCNGKVGKVVVLESAPKSWRSARLALRWIWDKVSSPYLRDLDITVQVTPREGWIVRDEMEKLNRQSQWERKHAIEAGSGRKVYADLQDRDTTDALERLAEGDIPLHCAPVFTLWRDTERECDEAASLICQSFDAAHAVVENDIAWRVWAETLPINNFILLKSYSAFSERRITMDSQTILGFLPLTRPLTLDDRGVEFITEQGGSPVLIDMLTTPERAIITGKTGCGKSAMVASFMLKALAQGVPVVGMDLSTGGNSTFKLLVQMLGGDHGSYVDILQESINLMEIPDLRELPEELKIPRYLRWKDSLRDIIVAIAMDQIVDQALYTRVNSITLRLLEVFLKDAEMIERYNNAIEQGWKSPEWQLMPTLHDLLKFCSKEKLNLEHYGDIDARAINQIYSQLEAKLLDPNIGGLIGKPSTVNPSPKMTFFALSGLTSESNSYIGACCAQMACLRVALEHPKSLLIEDELSVLLGKRGFADLIGEQFATGRKEGISIILLLQDMDAIIDCSASAKILANRGTTITGLTQHGATNAYKHRLNFPEEVIDQTSTEKYEQNQGEMYSRWLVERNGRFWDTKFFIPPMLLAALANNQDEKAARTRIMGQYPKTERGYLLGLKEFTEAYTQCLAGSRRLQDVGLTDYQKHQLSHKV
jgi:hypothetical protein